MNRDHANSSDSSDSDLLAERVRELEEELRSTVQYVRVLESKLRAEQPSWTDLLQDFFSKMELPQSIAEYPDGAGELMLTDDWWDLFDYDPFPESLFTQDLNAEQEFLRRQFESDIDIGDDVFVPSSESGDVTDKKPIVEKYVDDKVIDETITNWDDQIASGQEEVRELTEQIFVLHLRKDDVEKQVLHLEVERQRLSEDIKIYTDLRGQHLVEELKAVHERIAGALVCAPQFSRDLIWNVEALQGFWGQYENWYTTTRVEAVAAAKRGLTSTILDQTARKARESRAQQEEWRGATYGEDEEDEQEHDIESEFHYIQVDEEDDGTSEELDTVARWSTNGLPLR